MNMKRMRGRNHRPNGGGGGGGGGFRNQQNGIPLNRNHVFDSSGPEMRLRGTAQQLHEKYIQLARDASSNGDRVTGEAYYQHAEHYFRIISAINQAAGQNGQPVPQGQGQPHQGQPQHGGQQHGGQNGYQNNNQNDYQNRRPQHQQGNGNYYQEPQDNAEPRAAEPRAYEQPRQNDNRQNESRDFNRHDRPRPAPRPMPEPAIDPRIDISSALEAELAAAAAPAGFGEQPSLNIAPAPAPRVSEPAPEARAIPISTTPPEDAAPAALPRPRAPRGRPRTVKPEAAGD